MSIFLAVVKNVPIQTMRPIPTPTPTTSLKEAINNFLDMYAMGILITALMLLLLWVNLCCEMAQTAERKGYKYYSYFWLCFFTGIFGFIATMALKDLKTEQQNNKIIKLLEKNIEQKQEQKII